MTGTQRQTLRRRIQPKLMNLANVPMRGLLGLPVATPLGGRLMLAYIHGRRTGKLYKQPISYVRDGEVLLTPGGGKWKLNLDPATAVRLRIRGRDRVARPDLVRDQAEVTRLLAIMSAANPALQRFVPLPKDASGRPDQQALAQALRHGFCIVRWRLEPVD
ncbi:hypothetical protein Athai_47910 [Actinocatenispora thailandica]|uniref:Nitroreductase family deazaflavin-dependent oxidoreductase n=1 Tax=Actinocatenispora thailandica TaxID=227318 RepID=A0A7R7DT22_9ACTN|nr:nitroreductase/quinone reductase family protein [Actinocatenispora thailandica]BCJ37288.1 hypothetical protein Athai_47910 [Actinocatenispora thailandica]